MPVGVNSHNARRAAGFHFQAVEASVATNVQNGLSVKVRWKGMRNPLHLTPSSDSPIEALGHQPLLRIALDRQVEATRLLNA